MSVRVMTWVWANSRAEPVDRLVLLAIADSANDDGAEAYPSMAKLTAKTALHERSVQRSLKRLVDLGELVVYPNAGPKGCNRYRVRMATPGTAPPPAESRGGVETPRQTDTPAESRPDPGTAPPLPPAQRHPKHPLPIHDPSVEPFSSAEPPRPDVERICTYLADKIAANGSKRPRITAKWRMDARLLLDADGRTVEQVIKAIDWYQADAFWRPNIMSMPKLREKYDQLRLAAQRPANGRASPTLVERGGLRLKPETVANIERRARFEAIDNHLAIEGPSP